jgi:hypothetical protein
MDKTQLTSDDKKSIEDFISELGSRKNLTLREYAKENKDFISKKVDKAWTKGKKKRWLLYLKEAIEKEKKRLNNV